MTDTKDTLSPADTIVEAAALLLREAKEYVACAPTCPGKGRDAELCECGAIAYLDRAETLVSAFPADRYPVGNVNEQGVIARLRNGNLNVSGAAKEINALLRLHLEAANAIENLHRLHAERDAIMRDADKRVEAQIAETDAMIGVLNWCRDKLGSVALNDELEERIVGLGIDIPRDGGVNV